MKKTLQLLFSLGILLLVILGLMKLAEKNSSKIPEQPTPETIVAEEDKDKKKWDLDIASPESIYVLVNKSHPLNPAEYKPTDLVIPGVSTSTSDSKEERSVRKVLVGDLEAMLQEAETNGHKLTMNSGFRSYQAQASYFNNYVNQYGQSEAEKFSAKPGFSEHQTGLSFDLSLTSKECYLKECFADTPAGSWLADNSYKYGFIVRYPKAKENVTGYIYEPWHFRYFGKDVAKELFEKELTYEEFLHQAGVLEL